MHHRSSVLSPVTVKSGIYRYREREGSINHHRRQVKSVTKRLKVSRKRKKKSEHTRQSESRKEAWRKNEKRETTNSRFCEKSAAVLSDIAEANDDITIIYRYDTKKTPNELHPPPSPSLPECVVSHSVKNNRTVVWYVLVVGRMSTGTRTICCLLITSRHG